MAIKPGDCIIKLKDLEVGFEVIKDWDGRNKEVPRFEPFWITFSGMSKTLPSGRPAGMHMIRTLSRN